jgi:hypothetical protein
LIEKSKTKKKKEIIAYNPLFGTSSMKRHLEFEHFELVLTYVEQLATAKKHLGSQAMGDEGCRIIRPSKKCSKITPSVIFAFFVSTAPYKKQDEAQSYF